MMGLLMCMGISGNASKYCLLLLCVRIEYVVRAQKSLSDLQDSLNTEVRHFSLVTGVYILAGQLQEICA